MSVQLTKTMRRELQNELDNLFGRGRRFNKCPLTGQELIDFWHRLVPPDIVAAVKLLDENDYPTGDLTSNQMSFEVKVAGRPHRVRLVTDNFESNLINTPGHDVDEIEALVVEAALPQGITWDIFSTWIQNAALMEEHFIEALETFKQIAGLDGDAHSNCSSRHAQEGFCGTAGQLVRILPELGQHIRGDKGKMLREQKRASTMPFDWQLYDRSKIERLQFAIAKAGIMPVPEKLESYSNTCQTWAVYA